MKTKIFSFILFTALLISSCTPNNPQPNPPPNPTNSNWKFKLTINGNTTHMEGSGFTDVENSNYCITSGSGGGVFSVGFGINNQTAASYISGVLGEGLFLLEYPILGVNPITNFYISSVPWITNVSPNITSGYSLTINGTMVPNSPGGGYLRLPINITDLGSPGNIDYFTFGNPLKGNYSGTIYVKSDLITSGYDTPVTIDLDFVALRP